MNDFWSFIVGIISYWVAEFAMIYIMYMLKIPAEYAGIALLILPIILFFIIYKMKKSAAFGFLAGFAVSFAGFMPLRAFMKI